MNVTYLLVDFFTILVPFLLSFHPKLNFRETWGAFFPAVIISGIIFLAWDVYFIQLGVWGFNPNHLLGFEIFELPIEEILFFFCIPYAGVFAYHCLDIFLGNVLSGKKEEYVTQALIFVLLVFGGIFYSKIYTITTFLSLAALLFVARWILKVNWLGKFYIIYFILLIPFFLVNGILTGTGLEEPVIWYNENEYMGFRIGTIPVEDIFYGMELILFNLLIYKYILSRRKIFT